MTRYQSGFLRFLLFLVGAGIILLTFFLTRGEEGLDRYGRFTWISIWVMYVIIFYPFLFSSINIGNFSGKIPSMALVWGGICGYVTASIAIIVVLNVIKQPFWNAAIIIQSILFFIFLLKVYFAYFASSHVKNVAEEETEKQEYIVKIKSKANVLLLSVNRLSGEYANAQKILKQSIDDIKYIYPVNSGAGMELEANILQSLGSLTEITGGILSGANNPALESEAFNLQALVNERKLLRN